MKVFSFILTVLTLSFHKLHVMVGRSSVALMTVIALCGCFWVSRTIHLTEKPQNISIICVDKCGSELSSELIKRLSLCNGFNVSYTHSEHEAESALRNGGAEVMLIINAHYDSLLISEESNELFKLVFAPSSASAELVRETIGGIMLSQKAFETALSELRSEGFDEAENQLRNYMSEFSSPDLLTVSYSGGNIVRNPSMQLFANYAGFAGLVIMLIMFSVFPRLSSYEAKLVADRMHTIAHGETVSVLSDTAAIFISGAAVSLVALILAPKITLLFAFSLAAYSVCLTGLCYLLSRFTVSGRIDLTVPFIAIVTSLLGGSFMNVSSLSYSMTIISKLTPQGQLIAAYDGNIVWIPIMLTEGILLFCIALTLKRKNGSMV